MIRIDLTLDADGYDAFGYDRDGYDRDGEPRRTCEGCGQVIPTRDVLHCVRTDDGWYCERCSDESPICGACSGSGEGGADGYACGDCGGHGYHDSPRVAQQAAWAMDFWAEHDD